ncbi:PQQ-binding-like beta-propeller repeat protein [Halorubellus sp. JP-L1]|uniref:PQQ-binding-like beta-propeller repeat protein n=1 Tax=Halorubellus sp. JP-L1 TaxID=2715753 RepID=UPI00140E5175|nr:PQQ-binding-like beta-propeller repeat protein [Halorubellus sp. JP-L1]NHN42020.1 PQQ-binding-like beta-propeller repeat protein [Halorubellus sp. JP-L1]
MPSSPPHSSTTNESSRRSTSRRGVLAASASAAVAALAGCLGGDGPAVSASAWPMQGYDAGRTNHRADASPPTDDVETAFRTPLESPTLGGAQPVCYDGAILVPDGEVTVVDRGDGTVRGRIDDGGRGLALAAADGYRTPTLVAGDTTGVDAYDATGGVDSPVGGRIAARWSYPLGSDGSTWYPMPPALDVGATPVGRDGVVYHHSERDGVVARDASSGRERWRSGNAVGTRWFAVDEHVYVAEYGGPVVALDREDGSRVWTHDPDADGVRWGGVAAADGTVYANDGRGVTALDATSGGAVRWRSAEGDQHLDTCVPTVTDDRVVVPGSDVVVGFDRETGTPAWRRAIAPSRPPHLTAAGDLLLVPRVGYGLVALDATTGRTAWEYLSERPAPFGMPVVADGRAYVSTGEALVCLEGSR